MELNSCSRNWRQNQWWLSFPESDHTTRGLTFTYLQITDHHTTEESVTILHKCWKQPGQFIYHGDLIRAGQLRRPCLLWGQPSLPLNGYRSFPTRLKRPVREVDHIYLVVKLRMIAPTLALTHTPPWPAQEQL